MTAPMRRWCSYLSWTDGRGTGLAYGWAIDARGAVASGAVEAAREAEHADAVRRLEAKADRAAIDGRRAREIRQGRRRGGLR